MTLETDEFIRRFLIHVLPSGFHRIRHYGLLANSRRRDNLEHARELLAESVDADIIDTTPEEVPLSADTADSVPATYLCPDCGSPMVIIECFERGHLPRAPPLSISA